MEYRVLDIVEGTTVDGPGLRTSIYFAGCTHGCPGCHNPQSWNVGGGKLMQEDELLNIIRENDFNVTFTGGDPFVQARAVAHLAQRIKTELHKTIWCYTGYCWEEVVNCPEYLPLLQYIDVLVDGPFVQEQRNISMLFRGSENQRLIDVPRSLATHTAIIYELGF